MPIAGLLLWLADREDQDSFPAELMREASRYIEDLEAQNQELRSNAGREQEQAAMWLRDLAGLLTAEQALRRRVEELERRLDERQETRDKRQEAREQRQETGDRRPEAENAEPGTRNADPERGRGAGGFL